MRNVIGFFIVCSLLINKIKCSYSTCSDCTVFTTGKDGTLWGWEDNSFCKISSKCTSNNTTKRKKTTIKKSKSSFTTSTTNKRYPTNTKIQSTSKTQSTSTSPIPHEKDEQGNTICNGCVVTSIGSDGSKWGWEEESSCVINLINCKDRLEEENAIKNNAKAEKNHKKDLSGQLICNNCTITATSKDGRYWGYEDHASCVIDSVKCNVDLPKAKKTTTPLQRAPDGILICSTCEYTEIRNGLAWNKENGEDCRILGSRCGINNLPYPWCSGCIVTDTSTDGTLYGWENLESCIINEVTCGLVDKDSNYTLVESAAFPKNYIRFYYIFIILTTIFIIRGF